MTLRQEPEKMKGWSKRSTPYYKERAGRAGGRCMTAQRGATAKMRNRGPQARLLPFAGEMRADRAAESAQRLGEGSDASDRIMH